MKVQEVFKQFVIPRAIALYKSRLVLSDEQGNIITDGEKLIAFRGSIPFEINFQQTKPQDFINVLNTQGHDYRYPFVFIDSQRVEYGKDGNVSIGQLVIGVDATEEHEAATRDIYNYRNRLDPLYECLNAAIIANFNVESGFQLPRNDNYKSNFDGCPDWVDAVVCENFNLRMLIRNCYE